MKIYVVMNKKGKFQPDYGVHSDQGDAFRAVAEMSEDLSKYDVACFDLKKLKPTKVYLGSKSDYYEEN